MLTEDLNSEMLSIAVRVRRGARFGDKRMLLTDGFDRGFRENGLGEHFPGFILFLL